MSYTAILSSLPGARGTYYDEDESYLYFVRADGKLSRVLMVPSKIVFVSGGTPGSTTAAPVPLPKATTTNTNPINEVNFDTGFTDLLWNGTTIFRRNGASLAAKITTVTDDKGQQKTPTSLDDIQPGFLKSLSYNASSIAENGTSVSGNFYAVKTANNKYAKFRIFKEDGSSTKIEWVTYAIRGTTAEELGSDLPDPRDLWVVKEGSTLIAYVTCQDGLYLTQKSDTSNVFDSPVNLTVDPADDTVSLFVEPQQLVLRDGNVLLVTSTSLWRFNSEQISEELLAGAFTGATGLLLSADGATAYVAEAGPSGDGRIMRVSLGGTPSVDPTPVMAGLGVLGHMTWADSERAAFYVTRLGAANEVIKISSLSSSPTSSVVLGPSDPTAPESPLSVEVLASDRIVLASDTQIGEIYTGIPLGADVVLGLGFIPFQFIHQSGPNVGKADTTQPDAGNYFFKVTNVPLGGVLHLLLNHKKAYESGYRYYQVSFKSGSSTKVFANPLTDLFWDTGSSKFIASTDLAAGGRYTVRNPNDLWYNPHLSAIMNTTTLPTKDGLYTISISFYGTKTGPALSTFERVVLIDNNTCSGSLGKPSIVNEPAQAQKCGCYVYTLANKNTSSVSIDFSASHPTGNASYSMSIYGGGKLRFSQSGLVGASTYNITKTVKQILDKCNVGPVSIVLYVSTRVTNGYGWINDMSTSTTFSLVPNDIQLDEP